MTGSYLNVVEIESALDNLLANYPGLCTRIPLPHKSVNGKTSGALRISSGLGHPAGSLIVLGGMHGREWGSSEIVLGFAADLLLAYTTQSGLRYGDKIFAAGDVQGVLQSMDVVIFPLINPDGLEWSYAHDAAGTDGGWRKNRNPASSGGDPKKIGVDLNRNFNFLWDFRALMTSDVWTSDDPESETFFGSGPFSEPEARNVQHVIDSTEDARWLIDIHSASQMILTNWGTGTNSSAASDKDKNFRNPAWNTQRGDSDTGYTEYMPAAHLARAAVLGATMRDAIAEVRGKVYPLKQSFDLYPISGSSEDFAYSRFWPSCTSPLQGFVIEFGKVFHPPWSEMELIIADIGAAILAFCNAARAIPAYASRSCP